MNELILSADGTVTVVGDAGSVAGIIADRVREATIPAVYDADGVVMTSEAVPAAADLAVELTPFEIRTHPWRLPRARRERLAQIRTLRDAKLKAMDTEYIRALEGSHPRGSTTADVAAAKQTLRELPPVVETALATLDNTEDMDAYLPDALD